tara:strand:+ start:16738 stop:17262 length:525 start_codon:yes stop_codon:yes gene_type:complete
MEAIIAVNKKNIIGANNKIPWHVPEDLQYFRQKTQGHIIIMGRKTFESFPNGPLPKRINIVLTRESDKYKQLEQQYSNLLFRNIHELSITLEKLNEEEPNKKTFVIGGTQIYKKFFPECIKIHITRIESEEEGDAENPFTDQELITNFYSIIEKSDVKISKNNITFQHITYEKC